MSEVTVEMTKAAIKCAVEDGLIPKYSPTDIYEKNWNTVERMIKAAIEKQESK
jgi:hypothetical protein